MNIQISMFDLIDECLFLTPEEHIFKDVVNHGSCIEGSLKRIKANICLQERELAQFLKKEFGVGGCCYTGYWTWWDAKGIQCGTDHDHMRLFPWKDVAIAFKKRYGGQQYGQKQQKML